MRYLIIIEQGKGNLSAYAPDLPGCVTTGATRDEILRNMREAIDPGLQEDRESISIPNSDPAWIDREASSTSQAR